MKTRDNIWNELKEIAPALSKMEKQNFYSVPDNYFLKFKTEILNQVNYLEVKEELKSIAPELQKIAKKDMAQAPAHYFNSFPQQMLTLMANDKKIKQEEIKITWLNNLNIFLENIATVLFKPTYTLAFAGTLSVSIIAFLMFVNTEQHYNPDIDYQLAKLSTEEINTYLEKTEITAPDEIFELNGELNISALENEILNTVTNEELNKYLF